MGPGPYPLTDLGVETVFAPGDVRATEYYQFGSEQTVRGMGAR